MDEPGGLRGLQKVRAEFSLTALAYNLRRALNILGVEKLMAGRGGVKRASNRPDRAPKPLQRGLGGSGEVRSGFWRKMTKYQHEPAPDHRRSSIRRRFHTVCLNFVPKNSPEIAGLFRCP